jgi:hypothetical protein
VCEETAARVYRSQECCYVWARKKGSFRDEKVVAKVNAHFKQSGQRALQRHLLVGEITIECQRLDRELKFTKITRCDQKTM